ncbi:MAG TPA: TolC family protein [Cyclobacteriaceae bacterium]|nr:TolC family protein [Cyclobacteriaceae bacterium]HRJ83410.1 TolC family protein [Cyclobacteriaceae bacterium]
MNRTFRTWMLIWTLAAIGAPLFAQQKYTLQDVIELAKSQSPLSRQAETRRENRYWQYRFYKSNFNPQLRLSGTLPAYTKSVSQAPLADGSFRYTQVEQSNNNLNLGLVQPLFFTGGTVSVNSSLQYFNNYLAEFPQPGEQWGGTVMNIQLTQPIFAFNSLRWDRRTEPLRYEESRRSYVEEMEFISQNAVARFFDVLDAQINLQIAEFNLANNDTIYKIEEGRYNIGTTPKDKLLQAELQLLRSRQDVTQAKINLQIARLQMRSYLGLRSSEQFELVLPEEIPPLFITVDEAMQLAKENRADFIAFERRKIEADREVAQARGQRFQTNLTAAFGLNNNGLALPDIYQNPTQQQTFALSLNVPIIDWGRNQARMQTALANKKLNDYVIAQDEVNFEQEIITQVGQFDVLLSQIEITKKSDEVANERYVVSQNRYLIGKIDITNLNIALTEKDAAKRSYVGALRSFWTSYYDLRRLTLYDFSNRRLLYIPD